MRTRVKEDGEKVIEFTGGEERLCDRLQAPARGVEPPNLLTMTTEQRRPIQRFIPANWNSDGTIRRTPTVCALFSAHRDRTRLEQAPCRLPTLRTNAVVAATKKRERVASLRDVVIALRAAGL